MKKTILILAVIYTLSLVASCSAPVNKADNVQNSAGATAEAAATAGAASSAETASSAAVDGSEQITAAASEKAADSSLSLAGIKQAAQSAGFEVEPVQDYQMTDEPKAVDSFNIIYKDDYSESHIPVLEFKTARDAETYAMQVNEEGYNLCIINGKFLTMTGAQYGIPTNDNEKDLLEKLLKSTVMPYTLPGAGPLIPANDYAGAYKQIEAITNALDVLVNKSVLLHDKTVAEEQRISSAFVSFSLISSGDLAFTATLSEDPIQIDAVKQLWEMFGVVDMKIAHDAANDYILTGKRAGLDTSFELHCAFDPGTGSLRLVDKDGGEIIEFIEFVPLGGDKYAFQTLYERAIMTYKSGVTSFVYSLNTRDGAHAYNADSDSIYKKSAGIDEAWVSKAGADSYDQFITYDGSTLKIAADSMLGDRLNVDIKVQK